MASKKKLLVSLAVGLIFYGITAIATGNLQYKVSMQTKRGVRGVSSSAYSYVWVDRGMAKDADGRPRKYVAKRFFVNNYLAVPVGAGAAGATLLFLTLQLRRPKDQK